ncbi:MAG: transposase [Acidobacteriota bacterium]
MKEYLLAAQKRRSVGDLQIQLHFEVRQEEVQQPSRLRDRPGWAGRGWRRVYFRLLLVGYFEGLDSERAIAWRAADSLTLRDFLGLAFPEAPPDHSTISRTRRLIDLARAIRTSR